MPGRQSHGGAPSKAPKIRLNHKKRSLDAFAIAEQQHPEKLKIKQHRLGTSEGGDRSGKRPRGEEDEHGDESSGPSKKSRKVAVSKGFDHLDVNGGSDSEGNEWRFGQVDSDDDSDLDSEEAFGESDEERFEGFAFSGGSSKNKKVLEKRKRPPHITLDEAESNGEEISGSDDDSLGDGAIDLADMLDATEEDIGEDIQGKTMFTDSDNALSGEKSSGESGQSSESEDDGESISSMDDNDEDEVERIEALQDIIASLPQVDQSNQAPQKQRNYGASEYGIPSDYGVTSQKKLTLEDLGMPSISDPAIKRSLKLLATDSKGISNNKKLEVPLSKREQDRLNRSVAYEKSKETLARWQDTVKYNREAEHLIFPLPDADITSSKNNTKLQPTAYSKPFTDLEATIQNILEESGLAASGGQNEEDKLKEFEELESKKMSMEEVRARRDELRKARDLMFREEARAKRIKKIKSKSYRKVHRKQREKEERVNRDALAEAGVEPSDDEREMQDRRRAEERMGARHRQSKWAKATKGTGRAAWDEDARAGVTELARRDEELRKRVEGTTIGRDEVDATDSFSSEDGDSDDEAAQDRLFRKLDDLSSSVILGAASGPGSKLANMDFMLKADARRRKDNDAAVEVLRKELAGEPSSGEDESTAEIGRRIFGPGLTQMEDGSKAKRQEFEESERSDEDPDELEGSNPINRDSHSGHVALPSSKKNVSRREAIAAYPPKAALNANFEGGAWSRGPVQNDAIGRSEARRRKDIEKSTADVEELDLSNVAIIATLAKQKRKPTIQTATLQIDVSSDEGSDDEKTLLPFAIRDQELIKRAFAGADVVGEFNAEKRAIIEDDGDKIVDNTLPGWGTWTGDGLSKKDKKRNQGRFVSEIKGIKEKDRKDRKLERVIINEKQVKKNGKYLASMLPHPFETRQQYERSLRLPVGPEWATKETFQEATKPRILLKQGIIAPMSKPLM